MEIAWRLRGSRPRAGPKGRGPLSVAAATGDLVLATSAGRSAGLRCRNGSSRRNSRGAILQSGALPQNHRVADFSARYDGTATEHAHPSRSTATELVAHLEHEGKERGSSTSCEPGADCENAALQCYRASDGIHVSRALLQKSVHSCRNVFLNPIQKAYVSLCFRILGCQMLA